MMKELERVVRSGYEVGALGATEEAAVFYAARGWRRWEGQTWALTPEGKVRTANNDRDIFVLEAGVPLDRSGELTCDWRDGDVW